MSQSPNRWDAFSFEEIDILFNQMCLYVKYPDDYENAAKINAAAERLTGELEEVFKTKDDDQSLTLK